MFYKKQENNYFWFKSDKDKFFFGPFENDGDFQKLENKYWKEKFKELKTYKHLVWIWQNKIYIFEYNEKKWLKLIRSFPDLKCCHNY